MDIPSRDAHRLSLEATLGGGRSQLPAPGCVPGHVAAILVDRHLAFLLGRAQGGGSRPLRWMEMR